MTNTKTTNFNYNIPDNSTVGSTVSAIGNSPGSVEKADGKSIISKEEFAALLMLFNHQQTFEYTAYDKTIYLRVDISNIPYGPMPKFERLRQVEDIDIRWLDLVDTMLSRTSSTNKTSNSIVIHGFADSALKKYNSSFTFYINCKKDETKSKLNKQDTYTYFINANCSPTQLLVGFNSLPIQEFSSAKQKAKFLVDMFTLPFFVLGEMLDEYVFKVTKPAKVSNLTKTSKEYNNSTIKLQISDYCKKFSSKEERDLFSAMLGDVYLFSKVRAGNKGVDIPKALNYDTDISLTKSIVNKFGAPTSRTGFLLKFNTGGRPTFSLGLYNKDQVTEDQENIKENKGYFASKDRKKKNSEIAEFTSLSIRLDLSIHAQGLIKLSKDFNEEYGDDVEILQPNFTSVDIKKFIEEVLFIDPTLGIIYKYVFEKEMMIEQMLRVTTKQWDRAFDILKNKGLSDLIVRLKNRQNLTGNDESFTSVVKKFGGKNIDPTRLRKEIQDKTRIFKKDKNGELLEPEVLLCEGVDLRFPYKVRIEVDDILRDSYKDPEKNRQLFEKGIIPNDYDLTKIHRKAVLAGRKIARVLSYGDNLEPMPVFRK